MRRIMHSRSRTADDQHAGRFASVLQHERRGRIDPRRLDQAAMSQQSMTIQRTDWRPRTVGAARRGFIGDRLQLRSRLRL